MSILKRLGGADAGALRAQLVAAGMAALFLALSAKGAHNALARDVDPEQSRGVFAAVPARSDILDRHGETLATSVPVYSLFADPRAVWDASVVAAELSEVLPELDRARVEALLSNGDRQFVWLKRGLTPRQRQDVWSLGLEGLGFREEQRRLYPHGSLAGHLLGYTNVDGKGISGLELGLEEELAAGEGPVRLTLDSGVQFALEAELAAAALEYEAIGAAGVVLDAQGGDLLGLASWPPVDPNRPQAADTETKASRASGRVFELGSVFKPFTIAAGLDSGVISPADTFDARETVRIGPKSFRDKYHRIRSATVTDVLANSSNVGTVKVGLRLGAGRQQAFLEALGLFDRVDLPLPENERPLLPGDWTELTTATVSFGHGMSVTPLAFATAFGTFANGGEMPVLRIRADRAPADTNAMPTRVIAAPTAAMVVAMMRETVTRGTGRSADIPGYRVAGKTGTAEKPIPGGYDAERQVTSFAAVFPADDPRYVVFIVLDEPKTADGINEAAAYNAAPTAGRVVERIAPLLDVMPRFEDLPSRRDLDLRQVSDRRAL